MGNNEDQEAKNVIIEPMNRKVAVVRIIGDDPGLISHRFSEEEQMKIEKDREMGEGRARKNLPVTQADIQAMWEGCLYPLEPARNGSKYGFPAGAFGQAIVRAGKLTGMEMTTLRGSIWVLGGPDGLIAIEGSDWSGRRDHVPTRSGGPLRYRPCFPGGWQATLEVAYDADIMVEESVVNLVERAGIVVGVGDWRPDPQKKGNGIFGRWHLKREDE